MNGYENVYRELEEVRGAYEAVTEKDLLILIYRAVSRSRPIIDIRPKQIAVAIISVLTIIGMTSVSAARLAISLTGN